MDLLYVSCWHWIAIVRIDHCHNRIHQWPCAFINIVNDDQMDKICGHGHGQSTSMQTCRTTKRHVTKTRDTRGYIKCKAIRAAQAGERERERERAINLDALNWLDVLDIEKCWSTQSNQWHTIMAIVLHRWWRNRMINVQSIGVRQYSFQLYAYQFIGTTPSMCSLILLPTRTILNLFCRNILNMVHIHIMVS